MGDCFWKISMCKNCERKCAAASEYIFFVKDCAAASRNISLFFNERAAAYERYQWTTASERKKNMLLKKLCPLNKYFEAKNRLK